jgi:hypothetical protein
MLPIRRHQAYTLIGGDETRLEQQQKAGKFPKFLKNLDGKTATLVIHFLKLRGFSGIYAHGRSSIKIIGTLTINNYQMNRCLDMAPQAIQVL